MLDIGGRRVPIRLRRNANARRLILRTEARRHDGAPGVVITLPRGVRESEALSWVATQSAWIERHLGKLPDQVPFAEGAIIPYRGDDHTIRHQPSARRGVWTTDGTIFVSGREEHLSRRVGDWLKKQARASIAERVADKAQRLDADYGRIAIRDTKSRWGSCAAGGNLNFSWRLILAPDFVFDYVVAHEVAHLREHNHGAGFWRLVHDLTEETERARAWLNSFGAGLHRYG
ncbi:MAG: M48 family metallopeptidase [Rhodospirillaceae bacterium]|nr:M48 family metallopeptidase [Rhodospirillaceae bacterium]